MAVEAESVLDFRDDCAAAVTAALPAAAEAVLEAVGELCGPSDRPLSQASPWSPRNC